MPRSTDTTRVVLVSTVGDAAVCIEGLGAEILFSGYLDSEVSFDNTTERDAYVANLVDTQTWAITRDDRVATTGNTGLSNPTPKYGAAALGTGEPGLPADTPRLGDVVRGSESADGLFGVVVGSMENGNLRIRICTDSGADGMVIQDTPSDLRLCFRPNVGGDENAATAAGLKHWDITDHQMSALATDDRFERQNDQRIAEIANTMGILNPHTWRPNQRIVSAIADEYMDRSGGEPLYDDALAIALWGQVACNDDAMADLTGAPVAPEAVRVAAVVNALLAIYRLDA